MKLKLYLKPYWSISIENNSLCKKVGHETVAKAGFSKGFIVLEYVPYTKYSLSVNV